MMPKYDCVTGLSGLLRLGFVALLGAVTCLAQTAQITGLITDPSGTPVPDTRISVTSVETGIVTETRTNEQGYYTVAHLNPGDYTLTVQKEHFKAVTRPGIKLNVAQIARIDLNLVIGEVLDTVTVSAEAPILASETAVVGQVIGSKKVLDLPLNGRDFTQLATLVPGAIARGTESQTQGPTMSVNGGRVGKTVFMVDGGSVSSQYFDVALIVPSVDAIQEFSVQSNSFSAENGQGTTIVNVNLRSGTNQIHGSAFEFLRNQVLDARNFFNASAVRPAVKQNQFGFTFGGPVFLPRVYNGKDHTFFFVDYEGTRVRRARTNTNPVPTAAMRGGDFSALSTPLIDPDSIRPDPANPGSYLRTAFPGNVVPANRLSPQATFFLPFYPLANVGNTYSYSPNFTSNGDKFDIRADHRFSSADALTGSYSQNNVLSFTPGAFEVNGGVTNTVRRQQVSISETHSFGPATVNELRLGYVRTAFYNYPQGLGTNYTVKAGIGGFVEQSTEFPGFPGLTISGFLGFNANAFSPINFRDNKYEVTDNIMWVMGSHTFKAGGLIRNYSTNTVNAARSRGSFTFNGTYSGNAFADYMLGLPYQGQRSFPRNTFGISPMRNEHFFIQDDWKVTPRLTLNLGLRYELNHPTEVLHNQMASTDPVMKRIVVASDGDGKITYTGQQIGQFLYPLFADVIVPSSKVGLSNSLRSLDKNNFAPRAGVAWRAARDMVFRAGYGIFYGLIQGNRAESTGIVNPPFLADELSNFNTTPIPTKTLANMFAPISQGLNLVPLSFFQIEPNMRDPYFQEWNVTVQKAVHGVLSFEGAYVGSKGTKVDFSRPINVPTPGPGTIQDRRLWTRFASGTYVENSGYSSYNSFQGKVELRGWKGLSFLTSYAFGKSIDNLSSDVQGFSSQDPNNNNAEKGVSNYDVKHRFVTSANYMLPFAKGKKGFGWIVRDWEIGSIVALQTGLPFSPSIATDPANTGTSLRPDRVGRGTVDNRSLLLDFDPTGFRVPANYTYGNSGRNILYARGFKNWDFIAMRNFRFKERGNVQFRAEFFNFTNTPAFGAPTSNIQSSSVGRILSAGEPRDVQLALKIQF
jgi:hypothetical protein